MNLEPLGVIAVPRLNGDLATALTRAEADVARFKDYNSIENLESAYVYYLDKSLWDPLADLFARSGSMELAQRGVYKGEPSVREMLWHVFDRGQQGPAVRLGQGRQPLHARPESRPAAGCAAHHEDGDVPGGV